MATPIVQVTESEDKVCDKLCHVVIEKANAAIKEKGSFVIGLSGGSAAKFLCKGLPSLSSEWKKWRIFFCDERYVGYDDPECTYAFYKQNLERKIPDLFAVNETIFPLNPNIPVESAAEEYLKSLRQVFPGQDIPRFDLLVLGMGPDGHTCSLFPHHPLCKETTRLVASIIDSPKPPPVRVTFTFPVINNAACAVFAASGAGKADILQQVLDGGEDDPLPAAMVRPTDGEVVWIVDSAAVAKLQRTVKL